MATDDRPVNFADLKAAHMDGINSVWIAGPDGAPLREIAHRSPKTVDTIPPARGAVALPDEPRLVVIVDDPDAEGIEHQIAEAAAYVDSLDFF